MARKKQSLLQSQKQYVTFVLDFSGSMAGLSKTLEKTYREELAALLKEEARTGIETYVRVVPFGERVDIQYSQFQSLVLKYGQLSELCKYRNMGNTALIDAIGEAVSNYAKQDYCSHLVQVLTDGEENASVKFKHTITALLTSTSRKYDTTVVVRCPHHVKSRLITLGLSEDNITTWDCTAGGMELTSSMHNTGLNNYYNARSMGQSVVSNFYTPDTSFSPTKLKREAVDVTHNFLIAGVSKSWSGKQIRDFVEKELQKPYVKGTAFYQLTKNETVQANKEIVIRNTSDGRMYSGEDARDLLGLPHNIEIKVEPANYSKYELFIMSSSVNRKLVGGTKLLVKV